MDPKSEATSNRKLNRLNYLLYSLSEYVPTSIKKAAMNVVLAGAIGFTGVAAYGCGGNLPISSKDENTPVIQQNSGTYQNATENETETKSEIPVYSKDSLYGYAQGKGIDNYLPQLVSLENNGVLTEYGKAYIDLVAKYPEAGKLAPGIYGDTVKLPDLSEDRYSKIDANDLVAVEKILKLASDPNNKGVFEQILNEGIRDKRSYDAVLEALLWNAYDKDLTTLNGILKDFSVEKLIKDSWRNSVTSGNYKSKRWKNYEDVVARCISLRLAKQYTSDNFNHIPDPYLSTYTYSSPKQTFDAKGGPCSGISSFMVQCCLFNGDDFDEFEKHDTNAVCSLGVYTFNEYGSPTEMGHTIVVEKKNGEFFPTESTGYTSVSRSFDNIEKIAKVMFPNFSFYIIANDEVIPTTDNTKVIGSEQFKRWMKSTSYRENFTNTLKGFLSSYDNPSEAREVILESFDKYNQ